MLPEGWTHVTLDECIDLLTGFAFSSADYVEPSATSIRLLRGDNIVPANLRWDDAKHYSCREAKNLSRYEMREGDIVIALDRPIVGAGLKCSIVKSTDLPCLLVQRVARLRATNLVDQGYLVQSLQTRRFVLYLLSQKTETAVPHISPNDIRNYTVALPNANEQSRIVAILRTWDDAIATTEKLIANSRNHWLGMIGQLLMPVPVSKERQASSFPISVQPGIPKLPPTPKGWRKVTLGTHLYEINRPVSLESDTKYTLVTVRRSRGNVDKRGILLGREIKTPSQFYVAEGDFLISKRQIVHGACGIVPLDLHGAVVSNEYAVLGTDGQIDPRFLRYLSETTYFQQTCFHSSIGVHIEKMLFRLEDWLKWPFNLPPLAEQKRIVAFLETALKRNKLLEHQLRLLKEEKSALMQQLLTGKRSVRNPAIKAKASA